MRTVTEEGSGAAGTGFQPPVLAVITGDSDLAKALGDDCAINATTCLSFRNAAKFFRKAAEKDLFAVVWDESVEPPDWQRLADLHAGTAVIVLGLSCPPPTALSGVPIINVAAGAPLESLLRTVRSVADSFRQARRLEAIERHLAESQGRLAEGAQQTRALREHLEFYELQRNQLSEVVRRTAYLGQLSKEINCLDIEKIVDICVTKVPKIVDATLASVYIYDEDSAELILKQSNHPHRITDRVLLSSSPQSLMALAIERKATLLIRDIDNFGLGATRTIDRTYARKYATRSCIVIPLMSDNQVIAVLNLADKANGASFDEVRDLPLIDHIGQFIGIALRNCQLYQEVWLLAKTDALTGFMNHNAFFDELHRSMARSQRTGGSLSLILLDVDNFKLFNDVHGHQVGDMILSQVAEIIRSSIRTVDIAARYGGDEFAIILGDTDVERAHLVGERIRRAIAANQLALDGQSFFVTISAGATDYHKGQSLSEFVKEADAALYRAKSRGRNAVASSAENDLT